MRAVCVYVVSILFLYRLVCRGIYLNNLSCIYYIYAYIRSPAYARELINKSANDPACAAAAHFIYAVRQRIFYLKSISGSFGRFNNKQQCCVPSLNF